MRNNALIFGILSLLLIPFALATDTGDAIISIGALGFISILAITFIAGGGFLLSKGFNNQYIKWLGIFCLFSGLIFLYSGSGMASIYLQNISNALGGEAQTLGAFVFLARIIKYSPYVITLVMVFFAVKFFKETSRTIKNSDGWDNGHY